jgi:UDP-N-acetylglucosamine--dolichyl-phosphate N-acetylglucosaminephosphotransferase
LALLLTVGLACFIGFIDDILGWKKGIGGFKKILSTLPIVIPLAVIKAGQPTMSLPFIGSMNLGLFYPLLIVPLALIGTTNGFNLLAGYNGLEAGLGSIIMLGFSVIFLATGQYWLTLIALIAFFSLIGFLMFNKFPSKIFPGDSLTFMIGSLIGSLAILGNCEKIALLMFVPFIIEGFLKLRSKFKAENFARLDNKGFLHEPYDKIYSLTHVTIKLLNKIKKGKVTEIDVVAFLLFIQLILVSLVLIWIFV